MMGIDPAEVVHLRLVSKRLNYSINLSDYEVSPGNFKELAVSFKRPPKEIAIQYPDVKLSDKESCSACLSTVMFFLKRFKVDMRQYLLDDGMLHLAVGKGITPDMIKKGAVLIGNCTRKAKNSGIFVPGCPPVASQIYRAITGTDPVENEPDVI
jgi:hypothetical protein